MTNRLPFNAEDIAILRKLDEDVTVDVNNKLAVVTCTMTIEIIRNETDQFRLRFQFPGEPLDVKIRRVQLLEQFNIKSNDS